MNYANMENGKGKFQMIDKDLLVVPTGEGATQRNTRPQKTIDRMAKNWDWAACGVIQVIKQNGHYVVIDGGTRTLAAKKLNDKAKKLPCMVYSMSDNEDLAKAFLCINKDRTAVSAIDNHRVAVIAKDPVAVAIDTIVTEGGYTVGHTGKAYAFQAIGRLRSIYVKDEEVAYNSFYLCTEIAKDGENVQGNVLRGIFELEYALAQKGSKRTVFTPINEKKLIQASMDGCIHEINKQKFKSPKTSYSAEVCAKGIQELINKGRRSGKLRVSW